MIFSRRPKSSDDPDADLREPVSEGPEPVIRLAIGPEIDLHPFAPAEIDSVLEEYLAAAWTAGWRELRIIHGKGIGVQRERVRARLARTPFVERYYDDPSPRGGKGATLALLATQPRVDK
jgi:dsDNA-specific endonuclease/ATPase MutS2